jgi:TIR domain
MALKIFISHSSKSAFASKVRDRVFDALTAKGFEVLLDKERLEPGDRWRAKLHLWLATCDAAVILFSRDAVGTKEKPGSDWVQKEATILTWRQALNRKLLIVPALLGDVTREETRLHGLRPLEIGELQFVRAASADESEENEQTIVDGIVDRFDPLAEPTADRELQDWLRRVGVCLKKVDPDDLEDAATAMDIADVDWEGAVSQQYATFAFQLLFSGSEKMLAALPYLRNSMPADQLRRFAALVVPVWVSAEAARTIVPAARDQDDSRRFVAINTNYADIAEHYVKRATCCALDVAVVKATGVRGEEPAMALAAFELAFRRALNIPPSRPRAFLSAACRQQKEPWFALVGQGALARDVLDQLRVQYPKVTLVLVSGLDFPDAGQLGLLHLQQVTPPLDAASEQSGDLFISSALTALGLTREDDAGETE